MRSLLLALALAPARGAAVKARTAPRPTAENALDLVRDEHLSLVLRFEELPVEFWPEHLVRLVPEEIIEALRTRWTRFESELEAGQTLPEKVAGERGTTVHAYGVILGSGGPGLLYLGKRVCRPPGRRSGAREGYMGRSGSLGSSMGSIWATACPRTWPFGGVHVQSGVRKGRGPKDIYSTE